MSDDNEAITVYLRFKELFGGVRSSSSARRRNQAEDETDSSRLPFGAGRDPRGLGNIVDALTLQLGWNSPLAQSELLASWSEIVGDENARHSAPEGIVDGVLVVRCASTAWAAQLRTMAVDLVTQIATRFPAAEVSSIRFRGPDAPSWKRGPRSIPGRGPRDTYG
jgi:predicted nucleic acid-binding Zn ribbon protein